MVCPKCHKPYFFIEATHPENSCCLRCSHSELFQQPSYDEYHEDLYVKPYRRDRFSDPQMKQILYSLQPKTTDTVLDLGCGVGDYTKALHEYAGSVIGMDLSVSAAQKKYSGIDFRAHDLNTPLPFADASFDMLVSINLIEHLRDEKQFLSECARVLRPGGKIALTTANLDFILHDWFYDKTHVHEWTLNQFRIIMEQYFETTVIEKSSSMFNYYPLNFVTTKFLKPDILFIGTKQ